MKLSLEQKEKVALFLRRQDEMLVDLGGANRVQALSQIKQRIRGELLGLGVDTVTDGQVDSLLKRMKVSVKPNSATGLSGDAEAELAPDPVVDRKLVAEQGLDVESGEEKQEPENATEEEATELEESLKVERRVWKEEGASPAGASEASDVREVEKELDGQEEIRTEVLRETVAEVEDEDDAEDFGGRNWLGVCDNISARSGRSLGMIRFGFVVLGCLAGPIAILIYLAAYTFGVRRHPRDYPIVVDGRVGGALFRLVGIAGGMFAVSWAIEFGAALGFLEYFGQLPEMGVWGRMDFYGIELLVFVLVFLSPLAALGALPLAYGWGRTFLSVVNAGLAVYAVLICLGLAFTMVGYVLGGLVLLSG